MKIRITENQYTKMRLILEQTELINQFKNFCDTKVNEINKIYSSVSNVTVSDVLSNKINLLAMQNTVQKIEDSVYGASEKVKNQIDLNMLDQLEGEILDISDTVTSKIAPLFLILESLIEIQQKQDYTLKLFSDVKPIEIQSF
jgi:hypothetical protein